ncbi:MAG TPA: glycosyltransferase [Solirubrobacteraceae bacterium]|jgi:glycosyltransferase involved in cell wall biosynthesis|nr:glycosyltransferase [Solirubrobacteraceae bacterium]
MRVLIFHGYLLSGTGSNVYNARLAEALVGLGHEVHLFSQDRHPERYAFVDVAGDWDGGELRLSAIGGPRGKRAGGERSGELEGGIDSGEGGEGGKGSAIRPSPGCTVYRPNIGGLLPLYVQDRYEGIEAKTFADCSDEEIVRYLQANVDAVREVAELVRPEVALANHLVMGPVILARALRELAPYAVKVHGSALEYTVKPEPERFIGFAREGLAGAKTVLVGSRHTAESLWRALGEEEGARVRLRTRLGPPGVDVERFRPHESRQAWAAMRGLQQRLHHGTPVSVEEPSSAFTRDERQVADALEKILDGRGVLVAFVGKLIVSKGVDLLIAAWPLVSMTGPDAQLAIVGFGAYRAGLERLVACLASGNLDGAMEIARLGRALESEGGESHDPGQATPLRHLLAFLSSLSGVEAQRYLEAARDLDERVVFTGRLDHEELAEVLPACSALVVPSTFPEAFGMVAVEAGACGALPISAAHSGLAEVSQALAAAVPPEAAAWLSFPIDDRAVWALGERLAAWLEADSALQERTRKALVAAVRERWSWQGVALGVIAAARGEAVGRSFG